MMGTDENTTRSLEKIIKSVFAEEVSVITEYNNAKETREMKEILVSEAMKLACNTNRTVIVVGVDRNEMMEKDLKCKRFETMVCFVPYPVSLPDIFSRLASSKEYKELDCEKAEKACTVFGNRCRGNIYAGEIIWRIGHDLKNMIPEIFLSTYPNVSLLEDLFVPQHGEESELIRSYILEMRKLLELAEKSKNEFRGAVVRTLGNELFQNFPHFWGGE